MNTPTATLLRVFAHEHDHMPAFHAAFLIFACLSALLFNLGFFALLILCHMALDIVKYREKHGFSWRATCEGVIRESLMDITLIAVGLVFSVYFHHSLAVMSVGALIRAELSVLRILAEFIPKITILQHVLKIISHLHHYLEQIHPRHQKGWSILDYSCFTFIGASMVLLMLSTQLIGVEWGTITSILAEELVPWHI